MASKTNGRYLGFWLDICGGTVLPPEVIAEKVKSRLNRICRLKSLHMTEKVMVVNAIVMQAIAFHLTVSTLPKSTMEAINASARKAIRKNCVPANFPASILHAPKSIGGYGLMDLTIENQTSMLWHWTALLRTAGNICPWVRALVAEYLMTAETFNIRPKAGRWIVTPKRTTGGKDLASKLAKALHTTGASFLLDEASLHGAAAWAAGQYVTIEDKEYVVNDIVRTNEGTEYWGNEAKQPVDPESEEESEEMEDPWEEYLLAWIPHEKEQIRIHDPSRMEVNTKDNEDWGWTSGRERSPGESLRMERSVWSPTQGWLTFQFSKWTWLIQKRKEYIEKESRIAAEWSDEDEKEWTKSTQDGIVPENLRTKAMLKESEKARLKEQRPFMNEVQALGERYHLGENLEEVLRNHWANPAGIYSILAKHLHVRKEIFASPFNCTGALQSYCSRFEEDKIFGAIGSAWDTKWSYGIANPEFEPEDLKEAVERAHRDSVEGPVILTLPNWKGKKWTYADQLEIMEADGDASRLISFKKGEYSFIPAWRSSRGDKLKGKAPWGVTIWLIGRMLVPPELTRELESWKRNNAKASSGLITQAKMNDECPSCGNEESCVMSDWGNLCTGKSIWIPNVSNWTSMHTPAWDKTSWVTLGKQDVDPSASSILVFTDASWDADTHLANWAFWSPQLDTAETGTRAAVGSSQEIEMIAIESALMAIIKLRGNHPIHQINIISDSTAALAACGKRGFSTWKYKPLRTLAESIELLARQAGKVTLIWTKAHTKDRKGSLKEAQYEVLKSMSEMGGNPEGVTPEITWREIHEMWSWGNKVADLLSHEKTKPKLVLPGTTLMCDDTAIYSNKDLYRWKYKDDSDDWGTLEGLKQACRNSWNVVLGEKAPSVIKDFAWRVLLNRIGDEVGKKKRCIQEYDTCWACGEQGTVLHILNCPAMYIRRRKWKKSMKQKAYNLGISWRAIKATPIMRWEWTWDPLEIFSHAAAIGLIPDDYGSMLMGRNPDAKDKRKIGTLLGFAAKTKSWTAYKIWGDYYSKRTSLTKGDLQDLSRTWKVPSQKTMDRWYNLMARPLSNRPKVAREASEYPPLAKWHFMTSAMGKLEIASLMRTIRDFEENTDIWIERALDPVVPSLKERWTKDLRRWVNDIMRVKPESPVRIAAIEIARRLSRESDPIQDDIQWIRQGEMKSIGTKIPIGIMPQWLPNEAHPLTKRIKPRDLTPLTDISLLDPERGDWEVFFSHPPVGNPDSQWERGEVIHLRGDILGIKWRKGIMHITKENGYSIWVKSNTMLNASIARRKFELRQLEEDRLRDEDHNAGRKRDGGYCRPFKDPIVSGIMTDLGPTLWGYFPGKGAKSLPPKKIKKGRKVKRGIHCCDIAEIGDPDMYDQPEPKRVKRPFKGAQPGIWENPVVDLLGGPNRKQTKKKTPMIKNKKTIKGTTPMEEWALKMSNFAKNMRLRADLIRASLDPLPVEREGTMHPPDIIAEAEEAGVWDMFDKQMLSEAFACVEEMEEASSETTDGIELTADPCREEAVIYEELKGTRPELEEKPKEKSKRNRLEQSDTQEDGRPSKAPKPQEEEEILPNPEEGDVRTDPGITTEPGPTGAGVRVTDPKSSSARWKQTRLDWPKRKLETEYVRSGKTQRTYLQDQTRIIMTEHDNPHGERSIDPLDQGCPREPIRTMPTTGVEEADSSPPPQPQEQTSSSSEPTPPLSQLGREAGPSTPMGSSPDKPLDTDALERRENPGKVPSGLDYWAISKPPRAFPLRISGTHQELPEQPLLERAHSFVAQPPLAETEGKNRIIPPLPLKEVEGLRKTPPPPSREDEGLSSRHQRLGGGDPSDPDPSQNWGNDDRHRSWMGQGSASP